MKVRTSKSLKKGFTLIEMIGVLAVIAILAALLIPKIFEAINNARVNNAAISCQTVKTAIADHYAKFGSLASSNGVARAVGGDFDMTLVTEGFIDKAFATKIGTQTAATDVKLVQVGDTTPTGVSLTGGAYDLDGNGTIDTPANTVIVEAVIAGVTLTDALALSKLIDGDLLSEASTADDDDRGRVVYDASTVPTAVYVYLTHR